MNYKMPMLLDYTDTRYGEWVEWSDEDMARLSKGAREERMRLYAEYCDNRLSRLLPHGVPWHKGEKKYAAGRITLPPCEYPKEWENDGRGFVNDWTNQFVMMVAPRKLGKTFIGAAKVLLDSLECDPEWPCFKENGITYRPWTGPKSVVIGSYGPKNLNALWEVYRELMPRAELGTYAHDWGDRPGETAKRNVLSFGDGRPKDMTTAISGTRFDFMTYTQAQYVWENFKSGMLHADEQIPMNLLRAWEDGTMSMGAYTPVLFTLSGFVAEGRPDTGAGGDVKLQLYDGRDARGKTVGRYHMDVPSSPDALFHPTKKKESFDRYANPRRKRSEKDTRRGLAVHFPGWEVGGGLLFPDWDRFMHVIPPLWGDEDVPRNATLFRVGDHGDPGVTAFEWIALLPADNEWAPYSFACVYRGYYERNAHIADIAKALIERSGNERRKIGTQRDESRGTTFDTFVEVEKREHFFYSICDSRALEAPKDGHPTGEIYSRYGVVLGKASGASNTMQFNHLADWMRIDEGKKHVATGAMGAPRLYVFDVPDLRPLMDEFDGLREHPDAESRPAYKGRPDPKCAKHAIDGVKYWAMMEQQTADFDYRTDRSGEWGRERDGGVFDEDEFERPRTPYGLGG
ncbi:MAG: hypothetical protein GY851_26545 [bacterium]|nr:hypothetical protein [bacterium]